MDETLTFSKTVSVLLDPFITSYHLSILPMYYHFFTRDIRSFTNRFLPFGHVHVTYVTGSYYARDLLFFTDNIPRGQ